MIDESPSGIVSYYSSFYLLYHFLLFSFLAKLAYMSVTNFCVLQSLYCIPFVGDEAANSDDLNCEMDSSRILRVRTLHISSPILAAKSPFFYKVIVFLDSHWLHFFALYRLVGLSVLCFLIHAAFLKWNERVRAETCNSKNQRLRYSLRIQEIITVFISGLK